ncbi:Enoyl-CoA hydratase/isomerase [Leptothrix cholodnii SP-6]|uniref:Enoyl-CoA hydratase/isomerase n=1 Tax=Leptothrix cholodnii (strain ATCC 51168 / LMG 8142 / SP-6) TaxID=395495 RepID=B1Y656_LEPCP|nr:enoyl-CoA hydratase-related protein [Leptothrix cholodnii]ACB33561.1 Enoyl-CoA hydratase/isomerase [Leptothrix cholodnii SP-6]
MSVDVRFEPHASLPDVALVTLSNPAKLNAMSVAMWQQLRGHFDGLAERAPQLRCVILRGEGGTFVSGGDIEEFPAFRFDAARLRHFHEEIVGPALDALYRCDVPLVAQIERACVGGGLEIACQCDIRVAGAGSRFGAPIARLGFPMAPDEMAGVARVTGLASAAEILLEARLLDAATALQRGLVHRVVADDGVAAEAEATARRIAAGAPLAARLNKRTLRLISAQFHFSEAQRAELAAYASSADHREGIAAFIEKRAPRFTGA